MNRIRLFILASCMGAVLAPHHASWAGDGPVLPLPPEVQKELTLHLGAGVVGKALVSQPISDPSVYFPLEERSHRFLVTAGKNAGKVQDLPTARRQRPGGASAWRAALSPTQAAFVSQTDAGDLMMTAVTDVEHDIVVVATPANPFLLKGMRPGETRTFSQAVAVNYLDDPSRLYYSGAMKGSYTYVGTYEVTVPAGTYPSILMRMKIEGKIGPAQTEDNAYYLFAPQVGMVAMISQEDVEAFWVIHIDTTIGKVLSAR